MGRIYSFILLAVLYSPAYAQQTYSIRTNDATGCDVQAVSATCDADLDRGVPSVCTASFKNTGTAECSGKVQALFGAVARGKVDQGSTSGGIATVCRPVGLTSLPLSDQSGVASVESAVVCEGEGVIPLNGTFNISARITPSANATNPFQIASYVVFQTKASTMTRLAIANATLAQCNLILSAPGVSPSGLPYNVTWSAATSQTTYEVQEATQPDFSDAKTTTTSSTSQQYSHTEMRATTYYYRVRATNCRGTLGPYSRSADTTVLPPKDPNSRSFSLALPLGSTTPVSQQVRFAGLNPGLPYAATVDKTYLTVTPNTGTVGSDGSVTVSVRADPTGLGVGANTGTVTVTTALLKSANGIVSLASNSQSSTISVSLTTPVTQAPKTPPPPATLIVPAVAHKDGIGAQFISDIRLANASTSTANSYQLTFTPSGSDGTQTGRQTKIDLAPGQIAALNDILSDFFGLGTTSADASGVLEIRSLGTSAAGTVAASRTYSTSGAGTYGQFIGAIPIDRIATAPATGTAAQPLILSHVGQTVGTRVNVGLVEALGFATTGHLRAYGASGELLGDFPFTLQPFEHQQINSFLARNGIAVGSARIEVTVDAGASAGGVASYASQIDNYTQDASLVSGVKAGLITGRRFVVPGISEGTTNGDHSEVRMLNAGSSPVNATLTYYPQGSPGSPIVRTSTIAAGEIKSFDNVVSSLFGVATGTGSLVVTTAADATLFVTSRTFNAASAGGTYGRFQTAVTSSDGIATGDSELQVLQLEESDRFRSDVGIAEVSGSAAQVQVALIAPDAKTTPSTTIPLAANEYMNLQSVIASLGGTGNTYNARITLKVVGGTGRVVGYGSLIDKTTNDSTLVPAQR